MNGRDLPGGPPSGVQLNGTDAPTNSQHYISFGGEISKQQQQLSKLIPREELGAEGSGGPATRLPTAELD